MKRFVTYLYECDRGNKSKNVGFIRVNVRGEEVRMEFFVRNLLIGKDMGKIYALNYKKELSGIMLDNITIANGQGDALLSFRSNDIGSSGFSLQDIVGIGICLDSGIYIASCWEDVYAQEVTRGEFVTSKEKKGIEANMILEDKESQCKKPVITYKKIDLSQIRELPSPNWHLVTNSFLVHGFWNYGYLVLKKEMETDKETLSLGVPGVFEKPEAVMAMLFGFPYFEEVPKEMVDASMNQQREFATKEKNQEAKVGDFGCWFVRLKI